MNISEYRITSLSEFRTHTAQMTGWVQHMGGRLWLTRHGKFVAALVPVYQCQRLEEWERRSLAEERARMELRYQKWKRVKAVTREAEDFVWE